MARLIDLALQTAGLFELARSGCLMIPSPIDRITIDSEGAFRVAAMVAAIVMPQENSSAIDIDVADQAGHVILSVTGYEETVPLPFPSTASVEHLRDLLRHARS